MSRSHIPAALRREVIERARDRCEYCHQPQSLSFAAHHIDHIVAEKHGGTTELFNLALACAICNKQKGSDIASIDPRTRQVVRLFHPRRDVWSEAFEVLGTGMLRGRTAIGRATIEILRLNAVERVEERKLLLAIGELDS